MCTPCAITMQTVSDIVFFIPNWLSERKFDRERARENTAFDRMSSEIAELKRQLAERGRHLTPVPLTRVPDADEFRPRSIAVITRKEDEMPKDATVCEMVKEGRKWLKANPSATVEDYRLRQHWAVVIKGPPGFDIAQCAMAMTELGAEFSDRRQVAKA